MGSQQILLIVLGVIVVGIAVYVGLSTSATIIDQEVLDMALIRFNEMGAMANKYRLTPEDLGGGGGSYKGYELPAGWQEGDELSWTYRVKAKKNRIDFYIITTSQNYSGRPFYIWGGFKPEGLYKLFVFDSGKKKWKRID